MIGRLLDAAQIKSGQRVLDVATGPGYVAAAAMARGADVVGVDIAAAMVAAELARVLRPGGRLALSTWDVPERARLLGVLVDAVADVGAQAPSDLPAGPPFFRFADDIEFRHLLDNAGLVDVEVHTTTFVQLYANGDELWERLLGGTVRMRALVRAQPPEVQSEIRAAFNDRVLRYATERGVELPVSVKIAVGVRPSRASSEG